MLRSLYAYKGTHARTLGFQVGEKFLEIGPSRDPNWIHVTSECGSIGYVPKNYMSLEEPVGDDMLEFIDGCIEAIHLNASERGGNYTRSEHESLHKLVEVRQEWYAKCPASVHPNKRPAPPPPQRTTSQLSVDSVGSASSLPSPSLPNTPATPSMTANEAKPEPPPTGRVPEACTSFMARGESLVAEESSGSSEGQESAYDSEKRSDMDSQVQNSIKSLISNVPDEYLRSLVEEVRRNTSISYTTSHQVVEIILKSLGNALPVLLPLCNHILSSKETDKASRTTEKWQESTDGRHLVELLEKLRECKDDEQQRSWALHEDEYSISSHLKDLLDLLNNGDLVVCRSVLSLDDFRPVYTLVQYYQMETRWPLRKLLLQVFGAVCQMSDKNISYLSASVFPVELAREMLDGHSCLERLRYTSLVLGMVLCMGDTLPYTHFCVMNEHFISLLLDGIETYHEDPDTESLADLYMTLILAFNLQYTTHPPSVNTSQETPPLNHVGDENSVNVNGSAMGADSENIILKLLASRENTKYFSEKILLLFNREEDPLAMFDHEPRPPHSVLKMMIDLYSLQATASNFYTNDEKVVCDIIIRQLTDLPADDKKRNVYLNLMEGLIVTGGWKEHQHRQKELHTCCSNILAEEEPISLDDQNLIKRIMDAHSDFFSM